MSAAVTPAAADPYDLPALDRALRGTPFEGRVEYFEEIGSTNTHAMRAGAAGAPHGSVYLANAQTGGRGRGAHTWMSPAGSGIYVSVLLRPPMDAPLLPADALWLSLAAGLAAGEAMASATGLEADLRWPNDLLGTKGKLGGVLTEMQAEATRVRFAVVGIGINVHQEEFPPELGASSLRLELPGAGPRRPELLARLLARLGERAQALMSANAEEARAELLRALRARSSWVQGKRVRLEEGGEGVTEGLDERGFLRVRMDGGELRTVYSGGVREARTLCC